MDNRKLFVFLNGFVFLLALNLFLSPHAQSQVLNEIPYQDNQFTCFDQNTANRYVRDYNIDVASFGGGELCRAQVDFKKLLNDLYLVENGRFGTGDNLFIRGFVNANDYYSWMKSQTRGIERGQDIPYATAYNSGGYFTMQDGWAKLSTLGRVGTVIHEARHTAGYRHIVCQRGAYQGTSVSGCDSNYSYGGSHAVEMEYYARVSVLGQNFHPVYKKMARLMAIARSNIFFNTPVIQKKETLLVQSADPGSTYLLSNNEWTQREAPKVSGELKMTSFGAVVFDGAKAYAIDLFENSGFEDPVEDTYSYFKILLEGNLNLKEFDEYDLGTKRYLTKISKDHKIASYAFAQGRWGAELSLPVLVKTTSYAIPNATGSIPQGLYLITNENRIGVYLPETSRVQMLNQQMWPSNLKRYVEFNLNNQLQKVSLTQNGELSLPREIPEPPTRVIDIAKVPLYDGFSVTK